MDTGTFRGRRQSLEMQSLLSLVDMLQNLLVNLYDFAAGVHTQQILYFEGFVAIDMVVLQDVLLEVLLSTFIGLHPALMDCLVIDL
jgi:hypothetical protein